MIRPDVSLTHCPVCNSKLFTLYVSKLWNKCPSTTHDYDVYIGEGEEKGRESLHMFGYNIRNGKDISSIAKKDPGELFYKPLCISKTNYFPLFTTLEQFQNFALCA